MIILVIWLSIGLGVYLGLMLPNFDLFKKEKKTSLITGFVLTIPLWPLALYTNFNDMDRPYISEEFTDDFEKPTKS